MTVQVVTKPEKLSKREYNQYMSNLYTDHFVGTRSIHIDRLVQAEFGSDPGQVAARERDQSTVNDLAQEIIDSSLVFQSPLQVNVIKVNNIPGTQVKASWCDDLFAKKEVKFLVFGHQHFLEAIKVALKYAKDNGQTEVVERLTYLDAGIWVGLNSKDNKLLANIHNDVCHKIRKRDLWQLIHGLRMNYIAKGEMERPESQKGEYYKEYQEMKQECFFLENIQGGKEINAQLAAWRTATLPQFVFTLLNKINEMHDAKTLKGMTPLTKRQLKEREFNPDSEVEKKSLYQQSQKVKLVIELFNLDSGFLER